MYNILALLFKYIFIVIIYLFIFSIIRLIYLDIRGIEGIGSDANVYLKLINRKDSLPFKIKEYYFIKEVISLGRHGDNTIVVKDPFVSKRHFQIIEDEGDYYLEDLNSANGTYLNGDRIFDVVRLNDGDIIRVGQIEFLFVDR
ncbi:FHA domain-containing protein [Tissierella praeacuta]|uniref:FHA domain protein n=1 Tax=Tissierella praeacuta DSM 18095 TaxID=1123404 RepID=A0A1M4S5C6_9FIRM|nr:FHA domain-containing protein [Tissierella praeacuta]MBU5257033.1 FHA domain-containing protein [Tissierella praeacuta]TCU71603.1 FHA domain-containing protein [Tissierella praeacuta]SHE27414.1 FHA domain protein [Tissierella praeacuta DSM 18095]SUP00883.1 Probable regulatory protein embR [Tissierella praeacuta]